MAIPSYNQPAPQPQGNDRSFPSFRRWIESYIDQAFNYLTNYWNSTALPPLNTLLTGYGVDLASAAAISPTNMIHRVTGAATIETINTPAGVTGALMLYAESGFSIATGGNVTPALTVAAGHGVILFYHTALETWVGVTS